MRRTVNLLVLTLLLGSLVAAETATANASLQKARRLFENRSYREASAEFRQIVAAYPTSNEAAVAAYYIGLSEERQGNRQAALEAYNQMTQKYATAELARFARQRAIEVETDLKNNPAGTPASPAAATPTPVRVDPIRAIPPVGGSTAKPANAGASTRPQPANRPPTRPPVRSWPQAAPAQDGDGVLFPTEYLPASAPERDELAVVEFPEAVPVVAPRPVAPVSPVRPVSPAVTIAPQPKVQASLPAIVITPLAPAEPAPARPTPPPSRTATAYGNNAVARPNLPNAVIQGTAAAMSQAVLTPVSLPASVVPRPGEVISVRPASGDIFSQAPEPQPVNVIILTPRMPVVASSLGQTDFFRRLPPASVAEPAVSEPAPAVEPATSEPAPVAEPAVSEPAPAVQPAVVEPQPAVQPSPVVPAPVVEQPSLSLAAGNVPSVAAVIADLPPAASISVPALTEVAIPVSVASLSSHQVSRPPASIFSVTGGQVPTSPATSTDVVTPSQELVIPDVTPVAPEPVVSQPVVPEPPAMPVSQPVEPEPPAMPVSQPLPVMSWDPVAMPGISQPSNGGVAVDLAPVTPEPLFIPEAPGASTNLENMPMVGAPASSDDQGAPLPAEFEVGSQAPVSYTELAQLGAGANATRPTGLPAPAYTISITAVKAALKREAESANAAQARQVSGRLASADPNVARNLPASSNLGPRVDQSIMRAIGYRKMGQMDEAIAEYVKVLELDPGNAVARNNLADIYIARNERLDEAVALVIEALGTEPPDKGPYYSTLGWAYYARGDYENAEKNLNEAIKLKATAERLYRRGKVYAALGLAAKARADLDRALVFSEDIILTERIRQAIDEISTPLSHQVAPGNVR